MRSGIRLRAVVRARTLFCPRTVTGMGYAGAEVARCLGVTTSSVNRLAVSEELPAVRQYRNAPWNLPHFAVLYYQQIPDMEWPVKKKRPGSFYFSDALKA